MGKTANPFPLPSEVKPIPGTEGWENMYPYFTRVRAGDDEKFWFYNSMHFPEPMPAFDVVTAEIPYIAMGAFTTRVFAIPPALGVEHRLINGRIYISVGSVTDPEEIGRRARVFEERAGYYYENWDRLYGEWKQRMESLLKEVADIRVPELPDFEDREVVMRARGIAQNHYVREAYNRTIESFSKMWQYHFEFLLLGYGAYLTFLEFCRKCFPEIEDQTVARMVGGVEVIMYRPDAELKRLAKLAVDLDVDDLFTEDRSADEVLAALDRRGDPGQRWKQALEEARDPWFNMLTGDGFYHHHRSWNDDLSVPFSALAHYTNQVREGVSLDLPTEELKRERERIAREYRELLTSDEDRRSFDQMLQLCRLVFPYVEEHKFYCEHWFTSLFFNKIREFGVLLERFGVLQSGEDIFHLHYSEAEQALVDVALAWAAGTPPVGADHWQPMVAERKRILEKFAQWEAPPALGPVPETIGDPAVQMLWGITKDSLARWARPREEQEAGRIVGFAASRGVVEGPARVLRNVNEIGQIREGEILVCPVTNPSWGPVFGKIKAAVSDIGGTMSHAAIVAREYGMPAVVGTGDGTQRIKTGQRLRVDGGTGVVTVLD